MLNIDFDRLQNEYDALPYEEQLEFLVWAYGEESMLELCRDRLYDNEVIMASDVVDLYESEHDDIVDEYIKWKGLK